MALLTHLLTSIFKRVYQSHAVLTYVIKKIFVRSLSPIQSVRGWVCGIDLFCKF